VTAPLYTRDILRLAASIPHPGRLPGAEASVEKRAPVCGSSILIDVALDAEGRVAAIGQVVKACAFGQAAAALMGAHVVGRSPAELAEARDALAGWLAGERDDPGQWPGLDVLAPARRLSARHGAILLPFQAVAEAAAHGAREGVRP
jgi:NifU-like protein involved in Fe-S cluster formation